jgi:hypothetical protein
MKNKKKLFGKTMGLIAALVLCFGMTVLAAPSVTGDTELTVQKDKIVSASYKITNDDSIESVKLTLSYDKSDLTYMSGSGGDNFSGSGGNGLVELSSNPGSKAATFGVKFKGLTDGTSEVTVSSCTITVNGKEIDALSGVSLEEEEEEKADASAEDEEEEEDDADRATWVIDGRTFLTHHIPGMDGYDAEKIEIQGKQVRVLHNAVTDVYLVYLFSDNGSYRDYFVYNPDTGNIVPYIEKQSGTDTVTFIEPEEGGYVPIRYSYVDMPWGAKYTVPAYKHVIIDGVDEIFDDTNRYLVYGVNQDGEKAWYSYDYDKDSLCQKNQKSLLHVLHRFELICIHCDHCTISSVQPDIALLLQKGIGFVYRVHIDAHLICQLTDTGEGISLLQSGSRDANNDLMI